MSLNPITSLTPAIPMRQPDTSDVSVTKNSFADFITSSINEVNQAQLQGNRAIEKLQSGEAQNLHDIMISVEQADIALRMLVQVRNKALTAYEEIMRMQI